MFEVIKQEGRARRGVFTCAHGVVQTPVFMNVGTQGAIKGAVSAHDLKDIKCQIELSNTYHLHLRPGDGVVKALGGLHRMMDWDGPILTDSGGEYDYVYAVHHCGISADVLHYSVYEYLNGNLSLLISLVSLRMQVTEVAGYLRQTLYAGFLVQYLQYFRNV